MKKQTKTQKTWTTFDKSGKAKRVKRLQDRAPYRTWTLKDVLPEVVETHRSFKDLKGSPVVENFSIHKLVEKVGEAALLFLCHKTFTPGPDETIPEQEMEYVHKKFYEHIIDTIFQYEKNRRLIGQQAKKPKRKSSKSLEKVTVISSGVSGERKIEFIERKPKIEYDKLIKTKDIHREKEVDMKRAIPITVPKKPGKK